MFERFTDDARRVVVLAQEEAKLLGHEHIGTEHLLLGVLREGDTVAAAALAERGITLDAARAQIAEVAGAADPEDSGTNPFTARARSVLEVAMREARRLGATRIGPQHILLALVRQRDGVGAQTLGRLGVDLTQLRQQLSGTRRAGLHLVEPPLGEGPIVQPPGVDISLDEHREGSMQFAEPDEDPAEFARRVGIDPDLRVVLDHATANAVVYVLDGLEQMFRLDPPSRSQMRHFPEPFDGFARTVLEGALETMRGQLPPPITH